MTEKHADNNKKADPRFLARIAIFHGIEQKKLVTNYSVNVSAGGVFLETINILPVDTNLMLKFKLPDSDRIITCSARVAWTNDPAAPKKPILPTGMGVQFLNLSHDDLQAIRVFIEKGELVGIW